MKVYLSGGTHTNWREKVKNFFETAIFIDPSDNGTEIPRQYTTWDMQAIKECDIVFAYLEQDNPSGIGLAFEIGYAIGLGKTVIFVDDIDSHYTAILQNASTIYFRGLGNGINFLLLLGRIYESH